ncbi:hypothetical protein ABEW32_12845 [Paenibacillus jamilae]|uniref:hypothetical protein n=1 Tax=Paenibacillus jamilae TaxID=114136 RepID=UPI003D27C919
MTICHPERQGIVLDTILVHLTDKQIEILKESLERDYLNKYRVSKATIHRLVERRSHSTPVPMGWHDIATGLSQLLHYYCQGRIGYLHLIIKEAYRLQKVMIMIFPIIRIFI